MKKGNPIALLPIGVFLVIYLGLGLLFEYGMKIPMGFYNIPIVIAFLVAILVTIYTKLIVPLSKPLIATLGLFSALSYWNEWYNCMLYITDDTMFTLQYYLQRMLGSAEAMKIVAEKSGLPLTSVPLESMKMAMTVIATGPIILLYPFVQRYFVKGMTIGAVKG